MLVCWGCKEKFESCVINWLDNWFRGLIMCEVVVIRWIVWKLGFECKGSLRGGI